MAVSLVVNGTTFEYPQTSNESWGEEATGWAEAVTAGMLQKAGGAFVLTAEVDFGATYGLKSAYFKSRDASPSGTGIIRLGNTEIIGWRNAADSGDLPLTVDGSDNLLFNGNQLFDASDTLGVPQGGTGLSTVSQGDILVASATDTLISLAIGASGAVLVSDGSDPSWATLVNANINAAAAIDLSKLAALTVSRALVSDGSGVITPATTTAAEIGFVNGVTSGIQSQIDSKEDTVSLTANRAVVSDGAGALAAAATTATEIGYVNGVTSSIQTQLDNKKDPDGWTHEQASLTTTDNVSTTIWDKTLDSNTLYSLTIDCVGRRQDSLGYAFYRITVLAYREAGGAVTPYISQDNLHESDVNYHFTVAVSTNDIQFKVNGDTGHDIDWVVNVKWMAVDTL